MSHRFVGSSRVDAWKCSGRLASLLVALVVQVACSTSSGVARGGRYGYDNSVSAACRQSPAQCSALSGKELAEVGITVASVDSALRVLDNLTRGSIEQALAECAELARSEVLLRYPTPFKGPTPDINECNEWTVDAQGNSVTWAMRLGTEMHEVAAQCAEKQLDKLRPGGFSVESRYRYDSRTGRWKQVSPEEERALVESGNQGELRGSLKPDVVLHTGDPNNVLAIYDFKFPCVTPRKVTGLTRWDRYPQGHPHQGRTQEELYNQLLGPNNISGQNSARILPRWGVIR